MKGRVAIVTGSARGIGQAIAEKFHREGAKVVIADLDQAQCDTVAEKLGGESVLAVQCDVTKRASIEALAERVMEEFGRVDILVNNAGITRDASLKKLTDENWDAVIDVNLKSVFLCTQILTPYMTEQAWGRVINISSVVGVAGNFGQTNYSAAKAGIIGMTKTWSKELGKYNVTANAIAPGYMDTDMVKLMPEKVLESMINAVPLKRLGKPEEIAAAAYYLASEEAGYVNGTTLNVNGGLYV